MPGIVGLVTRMPRAQAEQTLLSMVETLRHEAFYESGTYVDESLGVYVGWIQRRDASWHEALTRNETGDLRLVFSGEEFPEPSVARHLKERGHDCDIAGQGYLVHLSEEDPSFPAGLNGRFQGLLIDGRSRAAMLFNDRYGLHRLYYHESDEAFYFAAEAKAILSVRSDLRKLDSRSLGEFVACGCVLEDRTLFEGIHVLPSASAWVFQNGSVVKKKYFRPEEWENQSVLEPDDYYQELKESFSKNLPRYFGGHGRVGMSLTGGLDTRMIMAWHEPAPGSMPCYSFGGMFRDCHDVIVARQVAKACKQLHQVIHVGDEFLARFPTYAERTVYLTDGCADVSRSADLFVNEKARVIAPVRMTGNYGGEVLRHVRAFKPVRPIEGLFRPEVTPHFQRAAATYSGLLGTHRLSFAAFIQAPWHHYGLQALEQTQLCLRTPFLDNDFVRTVFRAPASTLASSDVCLNLIADGNEALARIPTDRGVGRGLGALSAVSRGTLEFSFKAEYAYDYGMPQWLTRIDHALSPLRLERIFLGRHKFYHYRVWYRDALSKYIQEVLLDPRALSRPYIEPNGLRNVIRAHVKGTRNYTTEIHKVLTLELLHRTLLEPKH